MAPSSYKIRYIATIIFNRALGLPCSFYNLRAFNVFVVSCISTLALLCKSRSSRGPLNLDAISRQVSVRDILTGINVAFFPVLFFFSGLYYTDPSSTLIVLLAYANHLTRVGSKKPSFLNDVYSIVLGVLALGFRQTNIFWVVIYMGGLEVIQSIKALNPTPVDTPAFQTVSEQLKFYVWRYSLGDIHDPSLGLALPIGRYKSQRTLTEVSLTTPRCCPLCSEYWDCRDIQPPDGIAPIHLATWHRACRVRGLRSLEWRSSARR